MKNAPGCSQQRHGSDCTAAQPDACLYPARHVLLILTRKFLITKHLIVFYHFRSPYFANCFTRSASQLSYPRVKSSLSRSAYENNNKLKSSM